MDTPKHIMRTIDAVEAAQADIRSGKPELMLHGFSMMIAIVSEQSAMLSENYPEDRRMREFLTKQIADMKEHHALLADRLDKDRELEARRVAWRAEQAILDAERKARAKAERAREREQNKRRALEKAEQRRIDDATRAAEESRQGRLF